MILLTLPSLVRRGGRRGRIRRGGRPGTDRRGKTVAGSCRGPSPLPTHPAAPPGGVLLARTATPRSRNAASYWRTKRRRRHRPGTAAPSATPSGRLRDRAGPNRIGVFLRERCCPTP